MPSVRSAEGRVKAAPAASAASEALTRPSTSTQFALRSGGTLMSPAGMSGSHQTGLAKTEVPVPVTDNQVVEQRHVEHVRRGAQAQRQSSVIRAWRRITARMVVNDHQAGCARCETRGHKHIRHRDWCAVPRTAREHMPGEKAMLGGDTRDGEDLDGLIGDQRRQDDGSGSWVFQEHSGHVHDASVAIAQWTVGAHEFAYS